MKLQKLVEEVVASDSTSGSSEEQQESEATSEESTTFNHMASSGLKGGSSNGMVRGGGRLPSDEGLGMEEDPDDPLPGLEDRRRSSLLNPASGWSFASLGARAPANSDDDQEDLGGAFHSGNASDNAAGGGSDLGDRLKDFDDEGIDEPEPFGPVPMQGADTEQHADDHVDEITFTDDAEDERMST